MSWVVLRRASENTWEPVGPRLIELTERQAVESAASLAEKYANTDFAVAEIQTIFDVQREVKSRPASKPITKIERKAS